MKRLEISKLMDGYTDEEFYLSLACGTILILT